MWADLTEFDRGWIVGILEGEGTFLSRERPHMRESFVEAGSIDVETPRRLCRLLGGKIYRERRKNPRSPRVYHKWRLGPRTLVRNLCENIRAHVCPRRQAQIDRVLAVARAKDLRGKHWAAKRRGLQFAD